MERKNKNNPFRREGGGQIEKTKKEAEWGKVKFNPIAKTAITEKATPWSQFKNQIIQKEHEDEKESQSNYKNPKAKEFQKKREENYRRHLIESKRSEPTQWEDFSDEKPAAAKKSNNKFRKNGKYANLESITKDNFDSNKLTAQQNCYLKKVITREVCSKKAQSFHLAVKDMKLHGVKKKSLKK